MNEILSSVLIGIIQGITEWLPISSEGVITIIYLLLFEDTTIENAIGFAIWVHGGTAIAVTIYFRKDLQSLVADTIKNPLHPTPLTLFLVVSTWVSIGVVSLIIFILKDISETITGGLMLVVGLLMLVTALLQTNRFRLNLGSRSENHINLKDAILSGLVQGFSILPGISRSATTVSILIFRGFNKKEAIRLSFLMSVPASWGAILIGLFNLNKDVSISAIIALATAAIAGFLAIRLILHLGETINFSVIVFSIGGLIVMGSLIQLIFIGSPAY